MRRFIPALFGLLIATGAVVAGDRYIGERLTASDISSGTATSGQALLANGTGGSSFGSVGSASDVADLKAIPAITTQSSAILSAETSLGALTTGLLKNTVSGAVATISAAVEGTDYWKPGGTDVSRADGGTGTSLGAGVGSITYSTLNSDTTVSSNTNYMLTPSLSSGFKVTLPASPSDNDEILLFNVGPGIVLLEPNGNTINGLTFAHLIIAEGGPHLLRYTATPSAGWHINPLAIGGWPVSGVSSFLLLPQFGITLVTSKLSSWTDLINGYVFSQGTASKRLTFAANGFGNQPGFAAVSGSSTSIDIADAAAWDLPSLNSIWIMHVAVGATGRRDLMSHSNAADTTGWSVGYGATTTRKLHWKTDSTVRTAAGNQLVDSLAVPSMLEWGRNTTASITRFYYDKTFDSEAATGTITGNTSVLSIGGNVATSSNFVDGFIGPIYLTDAIYPTPYRDYIRRGMLIASGQYQ